LMLIARISFPLIWERVYAMSKSLIDVLTVFHLAMSLRKPNSRDRDAKDGNP